ncbi:Hypothetical_protein [Hexamita inflata]|uniref:Hypothetical_protein n=1 Tax=Hexamita inflata TaxID=28002 RepID=A0AA86UUG6_9EUKA|nr:Hypothetical protein HINF_LOCUS37593 [Hexamita inflata]
MYYPLSKLRSLPRSFHNQIITETQLADAKDKYDYIDIMLAEAMEEILESDLATKDLLDVMILSKDDGGLDLITPGAYFDLMIQNRDMAFQDPKLKQTRKRETSFPKTDTNSSILNNTPLM